MNICKLRYDLGHNPYLNNTDGAVRNGELSFLSEVCDFEFRCFQMFFDQVVGLVTRVFGHVAL